VTHIIDDPSVSVFMPAVNFKAAGRKMGDVRVCVIHTAECPQTLGSAVALGQWVSGPKAPPASWHYGVTFGDGASAIVQCVRESDVAWAAPGANKDGVQVELCGHATDDPALWLDGPGLGVLTNGARLAGRICKRWGLPVKRLTVAELLAGERGIIGHDTATKAYHKSTHTDPGRDFPWAEFLRIANEENINV
jgi:hypothetical protein